MNAFDSRLVPQLKRALRGTHREVHISGSTSSVLLSQSLVQLHKEGARQVLIILPDSELLEQMVNDLQFFEFEGSVYKLPAFDMSPYSGLYPNHKYISKRLGFLNAAITKRDGLFLATAESLLQKTLPKDLFESERLQIKVGSDAPPQLGKYLSALGYAAAPQVEDLGQYAVRGGIVDLFSPAHERPVRIELFGDEIESMRFFEPSTQRSVSETSFVDVIPAREVLFSDESRIRASQKFRDSLSKRESAQESGETVLHDMTLGRYFHGIDYLLGDFYDKAEQPINYFDKGIEAWFIDPPEITHRTDSLFSELRSDRENALGHPIFPEIEDLYAYEEGLNESLIGKKLVFTDVKIEDLKEDPSQVVHIDYPCFDVAKNLKGLQKEGDLDQLVSKLNSWRDENYQLFISTHTHSQAQRLISFLTSKDVKNVELIEPSKKHWSWELESQSGNLKIIPLPLSVSHRDPDSKTIFLREEDFFGKKSRSQRAPEATTENRSANMSFAELNPGQKVVHIDHGVAIYEGLKVMGFQGIQSEFLQLRFKDDDRLYLPVYRISQIQKFSGIGGLDKLGGSQWQKTKVKVKAQLRDIANELLELYAKRANLKRDPFAEPDGDFKNFEAYFPYEETPDQINAINSILDDFEKPKPMDRLVCGDVGFGKTEVALRAAFRVVQEKKQVAILVPTTILAYQHYETFLKRFEKWPVRIKHLSRFTPTKEVKETIDLTKAGKVDVVIGTHRLLSKDVQFFNLGLLVIDEEQRFGVTQKEQIRKLRAGVDTIAMSATPIPRTLNMSLVGIRDLSLINTAPKNRLPTRTFLCKKDPETIRKAILSEIQRGGQVFYVHNRVQSIFEEATELRKLVPEARIRVGHGKMSEKELESTMLAFFKHEFDVLISTTIIESGIDIPRANTMIIDRSDRFGLSQLYQLRGRIGRSSERAYCYLLLPKSGVLDPVAQDRLKTLQQHSDLGSGLQIAQHDMELRGAGNLLGEAQAGHVEAVGYELYLELLEEAIKQAKGEPTLESIEPEINIPIPALIPDKYIPDIRVRLAFYRRLSQIQSVDEVDRIEEDFRDQFGEPPTEVFNLLGVMIIRYFCKLLGIRDLSTGPKNLILCFTKNPKIPAEKVIQLATTKPKKYQITPDNRLICRLPELDWPTIYEELIYLHGLI